MGWIKLDEGFFLNPKVMALDPPTVLFHIAALCWAGSANTDGFVPKRAIATLAVHSHCRRSALAVRRLCAEGLWLEADGGYVIHDYLQWQRSAEERAHQQERNRVKAERHRQRAADNPGSNPVTNPVSDRSVTEPEAEAERDKRSSATASADRVGWEAEYEAWYRAYPRHRERRAGLTTYVARRRTGVPADVLFTAAERYAAYCARMARPKEMTKLPATFLNNGWEDWVPGGAADQESQASTYPRNAYEVPK